MEGQVADARTSAMAHRYKSGETLAQIAKDYSMTRERVRQIILKVGLTGKDGGATKQAAKKRELRIQESEARFLAARGLSKAEFKKIAQKYGREPYNAFMNRRRNSKRDNQGWNLKFGEFWAIWQRSGKWEQRGRGEGYQLRRVDPNKPWQPGNVVVQDGRTAQSEYKTAFWESKGGSGTLTQRLNSMEVAGSIDVSDRTASAISQAVSRCSVNGRIYLRKKVEGKYRVWRVQ